MTQLNLLTSDDATILLGNTIYDAMRAQEILYLTAYQQEP